MNTGEIELYAMTAETIANSGAILEFWHLAGKIHNAKYPVSS